jgi:hypothetical protein
MKADGTWSVPPGGAGGSPGGSSGNIQYNNAGAFGGLAPSGNGTTVVTTTGAQTSGKCVKIDANGNHVADTVACGGGSGSYDMEFSLGASGNLTSVVVYFGLGANTATTNSKVILPTVARTLSNLVCWTTTAPGAGITWTFTLNVNGTDNTNQQVTISNTAQTSVTVTNTAVSVSAGDRLLMHFTFSGGTPTPVPTCALTAQ